MCRLYVQHADFSSEELGQINCDQALQLFGFDPGLGTGDRAEEVKRIEDPCPLCIGFTKGEGYFLEFATLGTGGYLVRVSHSRPAKFLGLIPHKACREKTKDSVTKEQAWDIIRAFFTQDVEDVLRIVARLK